MFLIHIRVDVDRLIGRIPRQADPAGVAVVVYIGIFAIRRWAGDGPIGKLRIQKRFDIVKNILVFVYP